MLQSAASTRLCSRSSLMRGLPRGVGGLLTGWRASQRQEVQGGGGRACLFLGQPAPAASLPLRCVSATLCSPFHQLQMWRGRLKSHELCRLRPHSQHLLQQLKGGQGSNFRECIQVPQLRLFFGLCRQLFYTNCIKIAAIKTRFQSLPLLVKAAVTEGCPFFFLLRFISCSQTLITLGANNNKNAIKRQES